MSSIANVVVVLFLQTLIDDYITPMLGASAPDFAPLLKILVTMGTVYALGVLSAFAYTRHDGSHLPGRPQGHPR